MQVLSTKGDKAVITFEAEEAVGIFHLLVYLVNGVSEDLFANLFTFTKPEAFALMKAFQHIAPQLSRERSEEANLEALFYLYGYALVDWLQYPEDYGYPPVKEYKSTTSPKMIIDFSKYRSNIIEVVKPVGEIAEHIKAIQSEVEQLPDKIKRFSYFSDGLNDRAKQYYWDEYNSAIIILHPADDVCWATIFKPQQGSNCFRDYLSGRQSL